ncbi:hypothetical protein [Arenicella xantha]|uniref:Carboxypeptidase family protein n=1 Tax=Arenicella xantha TaxID=644221 RepID=A0A395JFR2_9GAMM|nr:hypothetical protein [Arenicella xantha]RBP48518.1 hypothetical protein DFR28_1063 [Arenicella xantha]
MNRLSIIILKALSLFVMGFSVTPVFGQSAGAGTTPSVCLYSQANFGGNEYCTETSTGFVPLRFSAASIKVSDGYQARLFRLPFYLGQTADVSGDVARFSLFGNSVRSIRMIPIEPTESSIAPALVPILSLLMENPVDPDDLDGDGFTNDFEIERGTDPHNAADYPDVVKPKLNITNQSSGLTSLSELVLTGSATDKAQPYSGIESISVTSSRFIGTAFSGEFNQQTGVFQIEVPLEFGDNQLTIAAIDNSGNQTEIVLMLTRSTAPVIESVSPSDGSILTDASFTLRGTIRTRLYQNDFVVQINSSQVVTTATGQADVYEFEFVDVPLDIGQNRFELTVSSAIGDDEEVITVRYLPEIVDQIGPPKISQIFPTDGSVLNVSMFNIGSSIESLAGPLTVTVNGETVLSADQQRTSFNLNRQLIFAAGQTLTSVTIVAEDSLGKSSQLSATYYLDAQAPVIVLDQAFEVSPAVTSVDHNSVRFSGSVTDNNLSSLLINNQSVSLSPGTVPGEYRFEFNVPLSGNDVVPVSFSAHDRSGNQRSLEYLVRNESTVSISAVLPPEETVLISTDGVAMVQVVGRIAGDLHDLTGVAYLRSLGAASAVALSVNGTLASAELSVSDELESQEIVYELRNTQGEPVTSDTRRIQIKKNADVPLEVLRVEPANNTQYIEPNTPIEVYFNQAIEVDQLVVTVLETLNGKSYLNGDPLGEDFIRAQGYVLSDINRDREPVLGQVDAIPGNAGVVFSPSRNYGYHADVFVEVSYQEASVSRSKFKVRELPTFINGSVVDQFGQPLRGIKVSLPELNRTTTTNGDGGFTFGYQEGGEQVLPGGSHTLLVNDDFASTRFGTIRTKVNLQRNRINAIPRFTLQELDDTVPFNNLTSGGSNTLLGGDLVINLSDARAVFPNNRTSGPVHAQFLPYEHIGVTAYQFALPHWLFGIQPKGIKLEGDASLQLAIPKLRGSYDYINTDVYEYVVLLGYSVDGQVVEPIGVGRIENFKVSSVGKLHLSSLDYLGYAVVLPILNNDLAKYANGELSLPQLKAVLQTQNSSTTD